ncbi:ABC transporter permease [Candidatus Mycoplasma pogonae]
MAEFWVTLVVGLFVIAIILSLAGLAGAFSEKVGIVNIGINGMMIIGAVFYNLFGQQLYPYMPSAWLQVLLFPLAAIMAMIFSWFFALVTVKFKADHVISGFAINGLALGIAILVLYLWGTAQKLSNPTPELAWEQQIPSLEAWKNIFSLKTLILIVVAIAAWIFLNKTKYGLRYRSVGENPQASDAAGINVNRMKFIGISISGFLSGLAGAVYGNFVGIAFGGGVAGLGFLALAVMIMGQWKTIYIVVISFVFAFIYKFSADVSFTTVAELQWFRQNVGELMQIIPYLLPIFFLAAFSKYSKGPKAAGQIYDKSKR